MNYDTDEFADNFSEFIDDMSDEEFELFIEEIDDCSNKYHEGTMLERLILDGNWWDSLMDIYYDNDTTEFS